MMPDHPRLLLLLACLSIAGCGAAATYPRLLPTDVILAEPALPPHAAAAATAPEARTVEAEASARAEALRRRAGDLRAPVIEPELRTRLQQAGG